MNCLHGNFEIHSKMNRLTDGTSLIVHQWSLDIKVACKDCGVFFKFIGPDVGVAPNKPMKSLDAEELRCPMTPPQPADSDGGNG